MPKEVKLQFQIICDSTSPGEELYIVGNVDELANWKIQNIQESQRLYCLEFPLWQSAPISFRNPSKFEYKFIIKKPSNNDNIRWELSPNKNRVLDASNFKSNLYLIESKKFNKEDNNDRKIVNLTELNNYQEEIHFNNFKKKGLANIGATCYMNSTLQCFCHIKKLLKYFKEHEETRKNTLSYSFKLLIEELYNDNNNCVYPYEFKDKISNMNNLFTGIAPNDAKDLVNFIIMQLHEELNKVKNNKNIINNNSNIRIDQKNKKLVLYYFFNDFKSKNKSIISDLFYGTNLSTTFCSRCQQATFNYQTYFFLVFPLEQVRLYKININQINYNQVSIYDCFDYDSKTNYMTGSNIMYCNYCKINTNSTIKSNLITGPNVLILLLNRGKGIQFNVKVIFEEMLNLHNYIEYKNTGFKYSLFGVITHIGESGMGGHFIAYCRDPINNQWNKFNDAIVTPVCDFKKEVIDFANPYLLFYQKFL